MRSHKQNIFHFLVLVLLIFTGISCKEDIKHYAAISHTRLNDNSGVNSAVSEVKLANYDVLLLGGDMANLSAHDDFILKYLDSVFDVSNTKTLWALGNHDYTNVDLLKSYTKKETYYPYSQDNTLFIVLDTQLDSSRISGDQLHFFESVTDTMTRYDNLIILTHKLIWMRDNVCLEDQIDSVSNGHFGACSYCIQPNNFYTDIYPKLINLKAKNINVFCVAGDIGFKVSKFEYVTSEGVIFLATGMNSGAEKNSFLEFSNDLGTTEIRYSFRDLTRK